MATVQELVIAGIARSGKMRNQQIATDSPEILKMVQRSVRTVFSIAARVNPFYFGKRTAVSFVTDSWTWPDDMELLFGLKDPSQRNVAVVPFDQLDAEPTMPAVYAMGPRLYCAGNALDPSSGPLAFFYSRRPVDPATFASEIDPGIPAAYHDIFINQIAAYFSAKDGRTEDRGVFNDEYSASVTIFAAHLEHATASIERRKFGQIRRFNLQTLMPTGSPANGGVAG